MSVDALVFDFDGLIVDTELPEYLTVKAEFEAHGLELRLEEWLAAVGRADQPHWLDWLEEAAGQPIEREMVRARRQAAHAELILCTEVLPGVEALLDEAGARGIPVAVASSSPRYWVEGQLERVGIRERFSLLRTREDVTRAKPWPDLYLEALEALGADPAASVALEDSYVGSMAAIAAGLFCVVAPNQLTRHQVFDHADLVVGSLVEVDLDKVAQRVKARRRQVG